ncbi:MAG: cyclase family protein [Cyanobacteria bacterium P01_E01_bin.42]
MIHSQKIEMKHFHRLYRKNKNLLVLAIAALTLLCSWVLVHDFSPKQGDRAIAARPGHISDPEKYLNLDADQVMHFPGFGPDSAELLLDRNVVGIGIDTLSLDRGISKKFETHLVMLNANKYQIENLANLDALPPIGATIIVGVLPVKDGSQAQARVLALLP